MRSQVFGWMGTGRVPTWWRWTAYALMLALTAGLIEAPAAPARAAVPAPQRQAPAAGKSPCPVDRADEASAAVAAKLCGARVEVSNRRSETTQVFANPDGTYTEERSLAPVRFVDGGEWRAVDLDLVPQPDGSVTPKGHPGGLRFAGAATGAGEHEVVSLGEGDARTSVSWNGPLPRPVLSGRTATYPEVLPGVDLVFEAHATGYQQLFVVKDRAALARVRKLSLPMRTGKLTAAGDGMGGLLFKDRSGRAVARAQTPEMWDAEVLPQSLEHVRRGPVALRTVAKGAGRSVLELTPDAEFLAREDLRFPVTIDPPTSLSPAFDAFVQNGFTSDQSGSSDLKLGYYSEGGTTGTARSYLRLTTSGIYDAQITSAKLKLWNYHSWSCTANQWEAWQTDYVDSSARWTNQPTARVKAGTSTETKGYSSSCADGWVYVDVTKALQSAASSHWPTTSLMVRATAETQGSWKRFHSAEGANPPLVTITYNTPPTAPTGLAVAPCYTACGAGARTASLRPTLSAKLADSNTTQTLQAEFEVRNKATSATVATSGLRSGSPAWTNGATASWQVAVDLANNTTYQWRVRAKDPYGYSAWTGWTDLTIDTDKPGVPFVSATIYLNDGQPHGGAEQPDTFTFTPASGTTDLAAFVYKLDYESSATTVAATGTTKVTIAPRDGRRTLTVQAKDAAGNLSSANSYVFDAGNAALAQPLPGANVVRRTKVQVTTPVAGYTRAYFEYRRGPGGSVLPVPSANLTNAAGTPITATAASPVTLSSLGGHAIWNATDTLGLVGGVVELRAQIYTNTSTTPVYTTPWVRITVDSSGGGGASEPIGPGEVNLLTGDFSLSETDVDVLGLTVTRSSASRDAGTGWQRMPERLTANQQQISTDLTGFTVASTSSAVRSTARGQGEVTPVASLEITPVTTTSNDTYVAVGGDNGGLRLGMAAGKTYRMTGWIFVPSSTGLVPGYANRGLRIVGFYKIGTNYVEVASPMAGFTEGWQELSVDMAVPVGATEAFFRLYNGMQGGSGKKVYWDNLSVTELVAPFGPAWSGGVSSGDDEAAVDYTTLTFPQPSVAQVNTVDGGWITFSRDADGVSYTPEPGAEGLILTKYSSTAYRLTDIEGTVSEFTQQGGVWTLDSSWTPDSSSTTRYLYDTSGGRSLLKKVISPVEPGVDDANRCTGATPARGCEVLEYVYATSTTSGLSQSVFGDYTDRVSAVKLWSWDPTAAAVTAVEVARYAYDNLGQLRQVWDPRISPALKTAYGYDAAGRVNSTTPPGELPWTADHGNPDVDSAALRWDLDAGSGTTVADSSGAGRNGTMASGVNWAQGNDPNNPADRAANFTGVSGQQISVAGTALSNTASYTVSAWVRLTDRSTNRTVLSRDGSYTSAFLLNYVQLEDRWAFGRISSDSSTGTPIRAYSNAAPVLGQWTHLAGVYDTATGKMTLYVNGIAQSTTAATGGWNGSGNYAIGRSLWNGLPTNAWAGGIDDVRIYGKALTAAQVATLAGDEDPGRLLRVRRAALQVGTKSTTDGEVASNVVYRVPLTRAAGGPYDLSAAAAATWGQTDVPTDATAVFDPEDNPGRNNATPSSPGTSGYPYATVHYLNANGQEVNTANPGGHIDTEEYDRFGNVIRTLSATDRALALGTLPDAATYLDELGLSGSDTASRAQALSTVNRYSSDGLTLLDTLGPTMTMVVEDGLADPDGSGPLAAVPAGASVIGRTHTIRRYDEGKPDGATYNLLTTELEGAQVVGYPDADQRTTRYGYDAHNGGVSGWTLKKYTSMTADAGSGGTPLTAYGVFDSAGRATSSWGLGSSGSDARARETIYYTAGANPRDAACGNRPEWAGQACVHRPVGAVTGHDPDRMTSTLPERRVTRYDRYGEAAETVETVAGKTRTTVTTFDAAGRSTGVSITSTEGAAIEEVTTTYDPANGTIATTRKGNATITREYDQLGRLMKYTDAAGAATVTEFDRFDKPTKVTDPTGWMTLTYNRAAEPRGLLTSVTDSVAGTFMGRYSPDGQLVEMTYPGGVTRRDRLDANQEPVERTYTHDSDGAVLYSESIVENSAGKVVNHDYTGGSKVYSYDRQGRLSRVQHDSAMAGGCVTRAYTYDSRTNRTDKRSYDPAENGECQQGTVAAQEGHTYDSADRITDAGYSYDAFGRTTALPGGLTNTYYVNDLIAGQQVGDAKQTWTLDPAHRFLGVTGQTLVDDAWVTSTSRLNHYADDSDDVSWVVEDTATGAVTRNVSGLDDDLVATTSSDGDVLLHLTNLHGDVAVTVDRDLTEPQVFDYDEFGVPAEGQASQRYGWLGGKQRSGDTLGGLILMGVRLYSPVLGRFLQVDPVDGGSAGPYDYCSADPVNCNDLDGRSLWGKIKSGFRKTVRFVRKNPAFVCATVSLFTPPPFNIVFGAAAVGFSARSAYKNIKARRYGAAAFDIIGAIPGGGSVFRGLGAMRKAAQARKISRGIRKAKGYRGAKKDKRKIIKARNKKIRDQRRLQRKEKWWGRWDKRAAWPAAGGYTACGYHRGCSRRTRWIR
ncbi:LamG-like jellyroll fold domain-containing protein [Micromonospora sp. NPDC007271]|uniref:LamG-like jellyroll fold domain-containing protein n=1 Tax=Micromonospora sp. NPDC007271 TaxID=3154587 RepID=UPI0033DB5684